MTRSLTPPRPQPDPRADLLARCFLALLRRRALRLAARQAQQAGPPTPPSQEINDARGE